MKQYMCSIVAVLALGIQACNAAGEDSVEQRIQKLWSTYQESLAKGNAEFISTYVDPKVLIVQDAFDFTKTSKMVVPLSDYSQQFAEPQKQDKQSPRAHVSVTPMTGVGYYCTKNNPTDAPILGMSEAKVVTTDPKSGVKSSSYVRIQFKGDAEKLTIYFIDERYRVAYPIQLEPE